MHLPLPNLDHLPFSKGTAGGLLSELESFGSNPGNLKALYFRPQEANSTNVPLVVVLHGCTQTAASYDHGSGWSELASRYGFATLFPEQRRPNNPTLCFNWFQPADIGRGGGEAMSIAQMIETMIRSHGVDPERVFITGLSAGGAMTSVMLATYPELFAGGAIIAGLPHGAASSMPEALQQMNAPSPSERTTGRAIENASSHQGPWPSVSVWHGTADTVVHPSNAEATVRQWCEVHGVSADPSAEGKVSGYPHRAWRDETGKLLVEEYRVTGMGHGTPLSTGGEGGCGQAGPFMLEVGISSTLESARTWGLLGDHADERTVDSLEARSPVELSQPVSPGAPPRSDRTNQITAVIEDALRKAGLLK